MDLKKFFEKNKKAALAFSGGVDSVFLMFMAKRYGADIKAYFIDSAFQTEEDRKDAQRAAEQCGFELEFIYSDVLSDKRISLNSPERCYYCKHKLLSSVIEKAQKDGYNTVIDGNNASDSFEDRPGMRAVSELGVISPLRDCGLTKDDIRRLSEEEGIFTWDKPSNSCLATRIAGGLHITDENLKIVESAEDSLKAIGFSDFRVRYNSDFFLLQFKPKQLAEAITHRDEILNVMKKFGKAAVYIDLKGR